MMMEFLFYFPSPEHEILRGVCCDGNSDDGGAGRVELARIRAKGSDVEAGEKNNTRDEEASPKPEAAFPSRPVGFRNWTLLDFTRLLRVHYI